MPVGGVVFTFDELLDAPPAIDRLPLFDEIALILQYDDVVELHDLHRGEVLARLGLRQVS